MISRVYQLFFFLFFALPLFAGATVLPRTGGDGINNSCNTGSLQCCNSVQQASQIPTLINNVGLGAIIGLLGQVGVTCTPITVIGTGGNSCTTQPACCSGNTFNGLITLGCSPININL
ncbi:hypothetical protein CVT24_009476 [Panaeolus cyanescens]|uniref:Hydrophobin n=1 Tax=Panaeolus cyanescens TaxID=181874 RepID=A0A409WRS2_9AGAR|nr:hypothetical protein CVT24_009476 [Panaeolus cyanescens]